MDFVTHVYQQVPPSLIYLLVAALLFLESSGIPVINTTMLLFTGALAAQGKLDLFLLVFVALLGSTLGACCAYGLGRCYGEKVLFRLARLVRLDEQKMVLAQRWFYRAGGRMIFFSRILPYIRPFACFPAGIAGMPFWRFLLAAFSGSVVWCVTFLLIGWELGPRWRLALRFVQAYTLPALGLLLLLLVLYLFARRALSRYVEKRLEAEEKETADDHDMVKL